MFLFYAHKVEDHTAYFNEVEMRHCTGVLRRRPGDTIQYTDGRGGHYEGVILGVSKSGFTASVQKHWQVVRRPGCSIHVGIAPTKNADRMEWFLEKATELGITEITPLLCANSERKKLRPGRLEKILVAAMKQSFGAYLPQLNPLCRFEDFIKTCATASGLDRFIAHCRSDSLPGLFHNSIAGNDVVVLIGPEGDFSIDEIKKAEQTGFQSVSLGPSRLRTETAGIAAVLMINLKNS